MHKEAREATSIEVLDQLADTRREKVRNSISSINAPDHLLMVAQTELSYNIEPAALPFSQINIDEFSESLKSLYKVQPETIDNEPTGNVLEDMLQKRKRSNALTYINGRFEISDRDFIQIKAIRFTTQQIHVVLKGPSSVAEVIIADCLERLWACAGVNKKFEELEKFIVLKTYGTGTKVKLPIKLEDTLSQGLKNLLNNDCIDGKKYAQHSSPKSYLDDFELNDKLIANYAVDEIKIKFNIFDPVTGDHNTGQLRFSVGALSEYGTGVYHVISELPYELHMQLIEDFVSHHST